MCIDNHGNSSQSYRASSPVIWDHTMLPTTWHRWMCPTLAPARLVGTQFTYPIGIEGWVDSGGCLYTEMVYLSAVTSQSSIWAWCMAFWGHSVKQYPKPTYTSCQALMCACWSLAQERKAIILIAVTVCTLSKLQTWLIVGKFLKSLFLSSFMNCAV